MKSTGETPQSCADDLIGGALCLDFCNTVESRTGEGYAETLNTYADLAAWSRRAGILDERTALRLMRVAAQRPEAAQATLNKAVALREAIYHIFRIFAATRQGSKPARGDLDLLNEALSRALAQSRLVATAAGFAWDWNPAEDSLDAMLWPIARSAADLLTSDQIDRVRECANETCGWLFVDTSRNRSRRWCTMDDCGNRAKARRHYHRQRKMALARTTA